MAHKSSQYVLSSRHALISKSNEPIGFVWEFGGEERALGGWEI